MRRFAALLYEALLVGAVSAVAGLAAGIANTLIVRQLPAATALTVPLTGLLLLAGWWYYFKLNWLREGQTLPMRSDAEPIPPPFCRRRRVAGGAAAGGLRRPAPQRHPAQNRRSSSIVLVDTAVGLRPFKPPPPVSLRLLGGNGTDRFARRSAAGSG